MMYFTCRWSQLVACSKLGGKKYTTNISCDHYYTFFFHFLDLFIIAPKHNVHIQLKWPRKQNQQNTKNQNEWKLFDGKIKMKINNIEIEEIMGERRRHRKKRAIGKVQFFPNVRSFGNQKKNPNAKYKTESKLKR